MKSLRKSLNGHQKDLRNTISTPLPAVSKPSTAITPPNIVIRALSSNRPTAPQELSFKKGDFFYVIREVDSSWYEAHNPMTGARGVVPRNMFEELQKDNAPLRKIPADYPTSPTIHADPPPLPISLPAKSNVFYAIVMHDFQAERPDELDAKKGDAITVVAQSNREWFVAKPIGRLGRPGLIPVTFVEVHDPATGQAIANIQALMDSGDLPRVEDWKRQMITYKQNSIALGVIDAPASGGRQSVPNSPFVTSAPPPNIPQAPPSEPSSRVPPPNNSNYSNYPPPPPSDYSTVLPEGLLLSADVVTFHKENEDYWFRIDASFQPYPPPNSPDYPPAMNLILFRVYNDFYDFQVSLLDIFPREAGREPPDPRILPYMPGPANDIDDALSATRREELDDYLKQFCQLRTVGARYILEHDVVRTFLALKPGDVHNPAESRGAEVEDIINPDPYNPYTEEDDYRDVDDRMERMRMDEGRRSDGSEYDDEGYAPPQIPHQDPPVRHPYSSAGRMTPPEDLRVQALSHSHQRTESGGSFQYGRSPSPYSRGESPTKRGTNRANSPSQTYSYGSYSENGRPRSPSRMTPSQASGRWDPPPISATSSMPSDGSRRSRSGSVSALNNPPISATNPQTAFVKIKIFDRMADDLIAIRVHPKVSHAELMEKVQARLGEVQYLKFRDSAVDRYVELMNDRDLRDWMENTERYVLYAD